MTIRRNTRFIGLATCILGAGAFSGVQAQTYFPSDVDSSTCNLSSKEFQSWITLTLPSAAEIPPVGPVYDQTSGMAYIFPPNGPNFEKNNQNDPNDCDFYKWGAQMFLWLTSTINDGGSIPKTPSFGPKLPYVFNSEFFYRLSPDQTALIAQDSSASTHFNNLKISLRTAKNDEDESIGQAGGNGVLLSQDGSLTYYGVHVNRLYGYFYSRQKTVKPAITQFPTTATETCANIEYAMTNGYAENGLVPQTLYNIYCADETAAKSPGPKSPGQSNNKKADKAAKVAAGATFTIPELEPAVDFLSMAVEVKSSWVDASKVPNKEDYIRQYMNVPVYDRSNGERWTTDKSESRELALVGMHIVGTVEGHEESIWATIEHKNNAPNSAYYYYTDAKKKKVKEVSGPQPGAKWLYSNGTVVSEITEYAIGCTDTPMPKGCKNASDIISVGDTDASQSILPSNVTRLNPWGNTQSKDDDFVVSQNTQLIALNRDVNKQVVALLSKDPRQNYFVSGAVWTNNGSIPTGDSYTHNTGSKKLANTTMETFHQGIGCFACHNSSDQNNGLNVSHVFLGLTAPLPKIKTVTEKPAKAMQ